MHPDLQAWQAWQPADVADRFAGLDVPWCVAGGWALDLFRGHQTREHEDLEVAVPAGSFAALRERLADCTLWVPGNGTVVPLSDEALATVGHQTWAWDPAAGRWRLDVFREPHDGDTWICRRDERLRRPYAEVVRHTVDGVAYCAPEIVLLFKAKSRRDKDQRDFDGAYRLLDEAARRWLIAALTLVHPGHPWLDPLTRLSTRS